MSQQAPKLRPISRFITTHDDKGVAVFETSVPDTPEAVEVKGVGDTFSLGYATNETPVDFETDLQTYKKYQTDLPGVMIPGGSVLRIVDIKPGGSSPMHRTVSLDYGVVIEGEIELELDSGEKRLMKRGDCSVQRGTIHLWRNTSPTEWARMLYVLVEAKPILINGKKLGEDYGEGISVKASGN